MAPRTDVANASPGGMASRFRQRLFSPWSGPRAPAHPTAPVAKNKMTFQAGIAELLLVTRLRARRRAEPSADVLERGARIVFVTCQNWFAPAQHREVSHRTRL